MNHCQPFLFISPQKNVVFFTLDDYSAHLVPEVEEAFFKKGYFLVIGGGITGDIQGNDTSYHRQAKHYIISMKWN